MIKLLIISCLLLFCFDVPISVHSVELNKNEIEFCFSEKEICAKDSVINVLTKATDSGDGKIYYRYTVTGGKIIGKGAFVKWNLSGEKPGNYSITAAVHLGDERVYGLTKTKVVRVRE